ncbi:hypothetical protein PR048_016179 [Dryococelus australis]|uniref:Uncharacterized protein n=1 Tax=Dryococelus australis TaxID=614101 RepID=A0ABQ9HJ04_9NEOP|nr:hypothetical protein PR048_016179 [Dryococelus australis]
MSPSQSKWLVDDGETTRHFPKLRLTSRSVLLLERRDIAWWCPFSGSFLRRGDILGLENRLGRSRGGGGKGEAAPECKGVENGIFPRKPVDRQHRPHNSRKHGSVPPGVEPKFPWCEASTLTATPLLPSSRTTTKLTTCTSLTSLGIESGSPLREASALTPEPPRPRDRKGLADRSVNRPIYLELRFFIFGAQKPGSDKGDATALYKCAVASTCKALDWRAKFWSCCVYLWDFNRWHCHIIGAVMPSRTCPCSLPYFALRVRFPPRRYQSTEQPPSLHLVTPGILGTMKAFIASYIVVERKCLITKVTLVIHSGSGKDSDGPVGDEDAGAKGAGNTNYYDLGNSAEKFDGSIEDFVGVTAEEVNGTGKTEDISLEKESDVEKPLARSIHFALTQSSPGLRLKIKVKGQGYMYTKWPPADRNDRARTALTLRTHSLLPQFLPNHSPSLYAIKRDEQENKRKFGTTEGAATSMPDAAEPLQSSELLRIVNCLFPLLPPFPHHPCKGKSYFLIHHLTAEWLRGTFQPDLHLQGAPPKIEKTEKRGKGNIFSFMSAASFGLVGNRSVLEKRRVGLLGVWRFSRASELPQEVRGDGRVHMSRAKAISWCLYIIDEGQVDDVSATRAHSFVCVHETEDEVANKGGGWIPRECTPAHNATPPRQLVRVFVRRGRAANPGTNTAFSFDS